MVFGGRVPWDNDILRNLFEIIKTILSEISDGLGIVTFGSVFKVFPTSRHMESGHIS